MRKLSDEEKILHPEVNDMLEDLDKLADLDVTARSKGGKVLLQSLVSDIVSSMDTLCVKYPTLTMQEFVALCADMNSKVDLARVLSRAEKNKKALEGMIEETLKQ